MTCQIGNHKSEIVCIEPLNERVRRYIGYHYPETLNFERGTEKQIREIWADEYMATCTPEDFGAEQWTHKLDWFLYFSKGKDFEWIREYLGEGYVDLEGNKA